MPTDPSHEKLLQYVNEAHAMEAGLVTTLTNHIAVTPRGAYRDLLERHLRETREQTARLQGRLGELGITRSPFEVVYGLAQTAIGQALVVGKTPIDLLRGGSGEEKLLKNAKDEAATEALEIATYDALEALAHALGDEKTATLAREHRTQEEVFLKDLRALIPQLAGDVVGAEVEGEPTYDPTQTGAADAVKAAAGKARGAAAEQADRASDKAAELKEDVRSAAAANGGSPSHELPIEGYDDLTADEVVKRLPDLSAEELAAIDGHERAGRNRKRVTDRVSALRARRTEQELARVS